MKKIIIAAFLAASAVSYSIETHLRFGGITNAKKYDGTPAMEKYEPAIGVEISQSLLIFDVGAGIQYNEKVPGMDIGTMPAYLLARWNIFPIGIKPYIVGKVGRSVYTKEKVSGADPEARAYYGLGAGINISIVQAELLYSVTEIEKYRRYDRLEQVSLMFGIEL